MNPQPPRSFRFVITEMLGSNAEGAPRRLLLEEKERVIGRSDQADLVVPLRTVSRRHAAAWAKDGEAFVRDLGSRSGTFVNSARVSGEPTPLRPGDRLSFRPNMVFVVSQEDVSPCVSMGR